MLDLSDLEGYCYSGVWNAGLLWREWVQCNDRRQHQKNKKTDKKIEKSQEKIKQPRKTWMLSRMGSNFKQKAIKKTGETTSKLQRKNEFCEEDEQSFENKMSQLSIPLLPDNSLQIPLESLVLPCGTFTEIQNAQLSLSPVIMKREKLKSKYHGCSILQKELHVLTQVHHPNILLLMGVVKMEFNVIVTVFEEATNGTLHHFLHQKKTTLSAMERQKFLMQLCHVMMFLHDRGWLHTAITSHTILITANSTLKLTGFELARQANGTQVENSTTNYLRKQWFQWQSPEQLKKCDILSTETDVFSVGLVSWEMCTNVEPWFGYTYEELLLKYESLNSALGSEGLPVPIKHKTTESFLSCMEQMLQIDPRNRTSCFLHVLSQVQRLQEFPHLTRNSISDQIQPVHFSGTLERAQLLFQPQPQKTMIASHAKQNLQDRDPITGLKRVSSNWQKGNGKSQSTANLHIVNLHTSTTSNSAKETNKPQKIKKHYINKLHERNQFLMENDSSILSKIQNHNIHHSQTDGVSIEHKNHEVNPIALGSSNFSVQKKYKSQPSRNLLYTPDTKTHFSRAVPIKPASHLNQRTVNFKNNSTKSTSKEQNILHGNILCQKSSSGTVSYEKSKWWNSTTPKEYNISNAEPMKGFAEQQAFKAQCVRDNTSMNSVLRSEAQCSKYKQRTEENLKKNTASQESNYPENKHSHTYQYSNENECHCQKSREISWNSDAESKENGFESTDSGIFTLSREIDGALNQVNSTEDLYIDDEFCLEMELESHMQLLCLFDDSCEYSEHFIEDVTEDRNLS